MRVKGAANWTSLSLALLVALPLLVASANCDGVIIDPWGMPFEEGTQIAFVLCKDGLESLALYVSSDAPEGSFWLVPVWSQPDMVVVSHVSSLTLSGYYVGVDASQAAKSGMALSFVGGSLASQLYPVLSPLSWVLMYRLGISRPPIYVPLIGSVDWLGRETGGVTVHEVVESYGLTSYVVTVTDADSLCQFLTDIGAKLSTEMRATLEAVLEHYINPSERGFSLARSFSFVVSRVSMRSITGDEVPVNTSSTEVNSNASRMPYVQPRGLGIVIMFPSDAPYYPLIPTSVYGSKIVPLKLYVDGLWDPLILGQPLSAFTSVEHFVSSHISIYTYPDVQPISGTELSEYTLVTMDPPSKYLTTDLTFGPASLARLGVNFSWVVGILIFLICSVAASGIASILLGARSVHDVANWSVIGLSNSLSVLGYYWAASRDLGKERHETSNWKVLAITACVTPLLLFGGVSVLELWLIVPHYSLLSVLGTLLVSLVAFAPALAVVWIYAKLNSSSTAVGAARKSVPIHGGAAGRTLLFSCVFVTLLAVVTNLLLL